LGRHNELQWNLGGWLGAQIGGTAWILIAGMLSFRADVATAVAVIAIFVLGNAIGLAIWRRKDSLSPHAGIQILLAVLGVCGLAAVFVMERSGIYDSIQIGAAVSARWTSGIIVSVVVALMLMFYVRFRRKR
jgi:hypothetical protein